MKRFLWIALGFYAVSLAVGVLLRFAFVVPVRGLQFTHALHAHSHTLYFGWAALGLLTLGFHLIGAKGRAVRALLFTIVALSIATFLSFLEGGYSKTSIVISSLSLLVWFTASGLFLRRARGDRRIEVSFFRAGVLYLALSGVSALGRVVALVAKVEDPLWGKLAVFGFLHCFAMFFIFALMSLLLAEWRALGAHLEEARLGRQLRWMASLSWLTFPLGVAGAAEGSLGLLFRFAALLLLYPAALWLLQLWSLRRQLQGTARIAVAAIGGWYLLKTVLEAGGALGLDAWATSERNLVVLFLHVQLVGFVSGGLLWLISRRLGRITGSVLALHHSGLAVMCVGLLMASTGRLGIAFTIVPGFWVAAIGGALIWLGSLVALLPAPEVRAASLSQEALA